MSRYGLIIIAIGSLMISSGCRNRCGSQCGSGGLFAGSPTISAPPTYSLNIPSVAKNSPYYVPGQNNSSGVSATLNPNAIAPTPNNNQAQLNGWRPSDNNTGANNSNNGNSTAAAPTTFANNSVATPNGYRVASATALPGSGTSFTNSTNYSSTRVDETLDRTRLPATDASSVRAPSQNYPTGGVPRLAQAPNVGFDPRFPNTFNATASAGMPVNNGQPFYSAAPQFANNGSNSAVVFRGQPVFSSQGYAGSPYTTSAPGVLAQSTASYDPYNGGQLGWRDREIGSESFNR